MGKYTKLSDSYTSVIKALRHAALACCQGLDLQCVEAELLEEKTRLSNRASYHRAWADVSEAEGIIVPGGFGSRGTEGKMLAAEYARTNNIPYLGEVARWWEQKKKFPFEIMLCIYVNVHYFCVVLMRALCSSCAVFQL